MTNTNTRIYITNLGKYNEGELVGAWITLPFTEEEQQKLFINIKLAHSENGEYVEGYEESDTVYEEYAIHDYESDISNLEISEYENIQNLSDNIGMIEDFEPSEINVLSAFLCNGYDLGDAIQHVKDGDYMYFDNCNSMADVAEQYADETGLLDSIPENLRCYFDFDAYGNDMDFESTFEFVGGDCIQLLD